jgi:hypothetical protein
LTGRPAPDPCRDCCRGCGPELAVGLLSVPATSAAEWRCLGPGGASQAYHRDHARAAVVELFWRLAGRRPTRDEMARVLWRVPGEG